MLKHCSKIFSSLFRYYLETEFEDEPGTTYYQKREDFIDSDKVNDIFLAWEKEHKILAKKFLENKPPDGKPEKRKLSQDSVGAVLSQGRSQTHSNSKKTKNI